MKKPSSGETIKLSFRLLLFTLVLMFGLGVVGGFVGQYVSRSSAGTTQNLAGPQEKFVTNVQQVTVSPNKNTASIMGTIARSVILISKAQSASPTSVGVILTNDGLVVTTDNPSGDTFFGIDQSGQKTPLEKVGTDDVYGLTYFRISNAVTVPVDLSTEEAGVGATLFLIGRSPVTQDLQADTFMVGSYQYAVEASAPAIQRFMKNASPSTPSTLALPGTPLVTDEGKVTGLLLPGSNEFALRTSDLKESLNRVIAQKREYNPFAVAGFTPRFTFTEDQATGKRHFSLVVVTVTPNSPAGRAGLKAQDIITTINSAPVDWAQNSAQQLSISLPIQLTVIHQGQERTVSLTAQP